MQCHAKSLRFCISVLVSVTSDFWISYSQIYITVLIPDKTQNKNHTQTAIGFLGIQRNMLMEKKQSLQIWFLTVHFYFSNYLLSICYTRHHKNAFLSSNISDLGRESSKKSCIICILLYIAFPYFWRPGEKGQPRKPENREI